jgi:hypothetical protein
MYHTEETTFIAPVRLFILTALRYLQSTETFRLQSSGM